MEFISANQLQRYEDIIDQIKTEFEKHERLKKELENENNKIIISQLADSKVSQKLSHINVKIFSDIFELFSLYHGELQSDLYKHLMYKHCKFYLIEIYITKSLIQKIRDLRWLLNVTVKSENMCVNKTIAITSKIPILEIFPIDENVLNCVVEASLMLPSSEKWMVIKLDMVHVDISYHIQSFKEKRKNKSKLNYVLCITKCYNEAFDIQELKRPLMLEYKLTCDVENRHFIQTVLKNCYHKLEIELFSELDNDTDKDFILQFSTGLEKFKLVYNKRDKYLIIKSNVNDLCLLKKYFLKEFHCPKTAAKVSLANLKKIFIKNSTRVSAFRALLRLKEVIPEILQEACVIYEDVRKSWSDLPL